MGYRQPGDPPDDREYVIRPTPFWESPEEQDAYEHAVRSNPRGHKEGAITYITRIAALVQGRYAKAVQSMPKAQPTVREFKQRVMTLERQREPGED